MFKELVPILRHRAVLMTITFIDEDQIRVNVVPKKLKDGENNALTTPVTVTGTAEELDAELGPTLVNFVGAHIQLKNTLESAKADMDAAAKAAQAEARSKTKTPLKKDTDQPSTAKPKDEAKPAEPAKPPVPKTAIYNLPQAMRRLGNLTLPKHLDRYMAKWKDQGVYHAIFDNVEDSLRISRLQCFDFQGVNNKQYADLIEPLMVWILRRIDEIVYDPKNLGVPKHVLIEEIFSNMKNKQLLEGALASIKTVRKNLGGVTMIGQSANDLGENADSIVNSCTSFLFLPDATFNRKFYGELFKLSEQQLDLFESLRPREGLYVRRDGITKVITLNLDTRSYAKFSTRPKDKVRRSKLVEMYGLHEGIERFAQGETV